MKICFLVSGGGGNLKFLYLLKNKNLLKDVSLYAISYKDCKAINFCKNFDIPYKVIKYSKENNQSLIKELKEISPDFIITTWNKIIDKETLENFNGKFINLHYSLLPAFKGLIDTAPIKEAYSLNCKYIGVTCHYVNEEVDSGKIISQAIFKTNVPIQEAINKSFRYGCLILLNSILSVSNDLSILNPSWLLKSKEGDFHFEPSLLFDKKRLNSDFWRELSEL